jgi:hypothetical protein
MKAPLVFLQATMLSGMMAASPLSTLAQGSLDEAEQEVLGSFFSPASGFQPRTTNYVVKEMTSSGRVREAAGRLRDEAIQMQFDGPLREAVDDLVRKSKTDLKVNVPTNQTARVTILSGKELGAILSDTEPTGRLGWSRFFQRFPGAGGFTVVSRIGIDIKRTVAILDVIERANGGGGTRLYVLRRRGNAWFSTGESVLVWENRYSSAEPQVPRCGPALDQSLQVIGAAPLVFKRVGDSLLPGFVAAQSSAPVPELRRWATRI